MIVTIDGPAGAGKSSAARAAAQRLGYAHMDTGAMYRALTWATLETGLDISESADLTAFVGSMDVSLDDNSLRVAGVDVTGQLRTAPVTERVSFIAAQPEVRAALVPLQRRLANQRDIVVEGRDIGTVVFPHADVKIYLTASRTERASRRARQLKAKDRPEESEQDIQQRDEMDATRAVSPLHQADDAHRIDSTNMNLEEVVDAIVDLVRTKQISNGS